MVRMYIISIYGVKYATRNAYKVEKKIGFENVECLGWVSMSVDEYRIAKINGYIENSFQTMLRFKCDRTTPIWKKGMVAL